MAKAETFQDLSLALPGRGQELGRWLFTELRAAILDGRLKRGTRMPSTRSLAKQYSLSRGTVTGAFERLQSEGYIGAQVGSGSYVAHDLPHEFLVTQNDHPVLPRAPSKATLSNRGRASVDGVRLLPASHSLGRAFRPYEPAIDLFPVDLWSRVAGRVLRNAPRSLYGQGDARGYLPLRKAITEYVGSARGVHCHADQVIVTSGAQQGLDLVARMLIDPGDPIWVEDPGYPGAIFALRSAGGRIVPVPLDREGLDVKEACMEEPQARLAYVTPANQFPLGISMSAKRRRELLDWAIGAHAWVIEDEYDAEYRYSGPPLPALQSMDSSGCVIYIGTFTKMLFNSLRLGFLVVPERIADAFAAARTLQDRHPPTLDQAILAEFILDGHFGHHVRRMRNTYSHRMTALIEAARERCAGALDVVQAESGMKTIAWIKTGQRDKDVAERARSQGLELAALSEFTMRHSQPDALLLGFAGCAPTELLRGTDVLANVLESQP